MERREFLGRGAAVGAAIGGLVVLGSAARRQNEQEESSARAGDLPGQRTGGDRDVDDGPVGNPGDQEARPPDEVQGTERDLPAYAQEYATIVDAVEMGADPAGDRAINGVLDEQLGNDTLLWFPEGEYLIRPQRISGYRNVALAADREGETTFVGEPGSFAGRNRFLIFENNERLLLDGIDFDFCRDDGGGKLTVRADGDVAIRNVSVRASCASNLQVLGISVQNQEAHGVVENFRAVNEGDNEGLTGVYVAKEHSGSITFKNCELTGFPDNGLYASAPGLSDGAGGAVHVEGGIYSNSNVSNIRVGTPDSTVRDATVVVDRQPAVDPVNVRGIRFRRGRGQVVEGCEIRYTEEAGDSFGAVVFHPDNAGATVRDTTIQVDRDRVPAIYSPYNATEYDSSQVFENVTIDGSAAGGYGAQFVGRSGVVFRDCTIEQTGEERHGVRFANKDGCRIVDSRIDVTGVPVVVDDAVAEIRNTTIVAGDDEQHIDSEQFSNEAITP